MAHTLLITQDKLYLSSVESCCQPSMPRTFCRLFVARPKWTCSHCKQQNLSAIGAGRSPYDQDDPSWLSLLSSVLSLACVALTESDASEVARAPARRHVPRHCKREFSR
eukprot:1208386-Pleurochrysis_carterae.AAC.2